MSKNHKEINAESAAFTAQKRTGQNDWDKELEETLGHIVKEQNGIIQPKDVTGQGIHPEQLRRYIKKNTNFQKVAHGIYMKADEFPDEFQILQTRFKRGIFSYETALFLHDLTDVTPFDYHMTFPQGYNNANLSGSGVIPSYAIPDRYDLGVLSMESPSGNPILVYDIEKTLCDMFIPRHKADKDVQLTALKRYMKRKNKDLSKLMRYAKVLKVDGILRPYLEVLL
ncbi:hypothetical protein C8U37_11462 [Trichococcus patagoniensis]|uniref:Uncharacterized protein n=1 Tax=Trichococcus patagoniensis TaxID=382641 RepID=A0A2T5IHK2_9LACT|nr:hypothetical protein [Trichococcus patagoniensis]PTQ83306.1 hypothetical protein C8U37_11462 [Trichococcus patagoniensis]